MALFAVPAESSPLRRSASATGASAAVRQELPPWRPAPAAQTDAAC
ncbi:hypothetical protein OG946_31975 [Streptomyces sp. NBC_01808]|nr:hypothetical protein [Streptomyces sp. NBC_01808]WSA41582.1 hypothetical protein OG946_31975 [Streptomyces sp. NBC_01808]